MSSASRGISNPALSIITPFFNPGRFFLTALQSVFAQTFTDWELLLLDDGSTDGSLEFARQIRDDRVRVVSDGAKRRTSYRDNLGVKLSRGQYIFRMDADDIMHPDRLSDQMAVLRSSSEDTVVGAACYSIDQDSKVVGVRSLDTSSRTGFAAYQSFVNPTTAASVAWFNRNPCSEEQIYCRCQDAELWCRTASYSEFKWISKPLLFYREAGVFSLSNYLATGKGLLHLIRELESSRSRRWWLEAKEQAKMGIAWGLDALHCGDLMVRHRYNRLTAAEQDEAERVICRVLNTPLPMR